MYSFPNLEPICCPMSSSNCCFLTCIQISQEAGQVFWYSHLFQNFPEFVVVHTVKGFGIVNTAEVDVFWNSLAFSMIQWMFPIWSLVPLPFLNPAWNLEVHGSHTVDARLGELSCLNIWKYMVHIRLSLAWRILSITLLACEMSAIVG